jgi:hypothetical protein
VSSEIDVVMAAVAETSSRFHEGVDLLRHAAEVLRGPADEAALRSVIEDLRAAGVNP